MVSVLLFDIGGVLINYKPAMYYEDVARRIGKDVGTVRSAFEPFRRQLDLGAMPVRTAEKLVARKLGARESDIRWGSNFLSVASPNARMLGFARRASKEYRLALLSNFSFVRYREALANLIDKDLFRDRFISCYLHMAKPDKYGRPDDERIYRYAVRRLRVEPNEILFIDDLEENLAPARRMGINTLLFEDYGKFIGQMSKLGISVGA